MNIQTQLNIVIVCPTCGKADKPFNHRPPGTSFGPWYCDHCGQEYSGVANGEHTTVVAGPRRSLKTLVLLEHRDTPYLFVVVEGSVTVSPGDEPNFSSNEFYYNEHTCPTNYLGVQAILDKGEDDPHGIFVWRETILMPEGFDATEVHNEQGIAGWQALFKTKLVLPQAPAKKPKKPTETPWPEWD